MVHSMETAEKPTPIEIAMHQIAVAFVFVHIHDHDSGFEGDPFSSASKVMMLT